MKKIESLLKTAGMKFEISNLEIRFYKRRVSFLVVKTKSFTTGTSLWRPSPRYIAKAT